MASFKNYWININLSAAIYLIFSCFLASCTTSMQEKGLTEQEEKLWLAAGWKQEQAPEIVDWRTHGFKDPKATKAWKDQKFTIAEAKDWLMQGFNLDNAVLWSSQKFQPSQAFQWSLAGFSVIDAKNYLMANIDPINAQMWQSNGFSSSEVYKWSNSNFTPEIALIWLKAHFTPEEANKWIEKDLNRDFHLISQIIPSKAVQSRI